MLKPLVIDSALLDELSAAARNSPRLRCNRNFHSSADAVSHRLLNAIEPGSYVRPHRHLDPNKDETMLWVRGRLGLLFFDARGAVTDVVALGQTGNCLVDIPHGLYHTVLGLEPGTVFFEAKAGPYRVPGPEEWAAWAPPEADPGVAVLLQQWRACFGPPGQ